MLFPFFNSLYNCRWCTNSTTSLSTPRWGILSFVLQLQLYVTIVTRRQKFIPNVINMHCLSVNMVIISNWKGATPSVVRGDCRYGTQCRCVLFVTVNTKLQFGEQTRTRNSKANQLNRSRIMNCNSTITVPVRQKEIKD